MAHWNEAAVTKDGIALLNEMMAGYDLQLTSAYGGTGKLEVSDLENQAGMTEWKQKLALVDEQDGPDGKTVTVQISSAGNNEEYLLQWIRVFAKLGEDGEEKLLFIMQDDGVVVPAGEDESFLLEIYCALKIGQNGKLSVNIDPSGIVTMKRLQETMDKHRTLSGSEDPTEETAGTVGQHYLNTETKKDFTCIAITEAGYVWEVSGANIAEDIKISGRTLTEILGDINPICNSGVPTSSTAGTVGQKYINTDSGAVYTCIAAELPEDADAMRYIWVPGSLGTLEEIRAALSNKAELSQISNPNLLDNWYFIDPINQRGLTEYTSPGYTIDRWKLTVNSLGFCLKLLDEGVKMSFTKDGITVDMNHIFEATFNTTDTVTFSAIIAGELYSVTAMLDTSRITPLGNTGISVITGPNYTALRFINSDNPIISAVKLEFGTIQTLAHKEGDTWVLNDPPPNKTLELLKCRKYLRQVHVLYRNDVIYTTTKTLGAWVQLDPPMRAKPTVLNISDFMYCDNNGYGSWHYDGTPNFVALSDSAVLFAYACPNTFTGDLSTLRLVSGPGAGVNGPIWLSSEP